MSGQHHTSAALPQGNKPTTNRIEGWVGPRAGLDDLEERNICVGTGILTPDLPDRSILTTLPHICRLKILFVR